MQNYLLIEVSVSVCDGSVTIRPIVIRVGFPVWLLLMRQLSIGTGKQSDDIITPRINNTHLGDFHILNSVDHDCIPTASMGVKTARQVPGTTCRKSLRSEIMIYDFRNINSPIMQKKIVHLII